MPPNNYERLYNTRTTENAYGDAQQVIANSLLLDGISLKSLNATPESIAAQPQAPTALMPSAASFTASITDTNTSRFQEELAFSNQTTPRASISTSALLSRASAQHLGSHGDIPFDNYQITNSYRPTLYGSYNHQRELLAASAFGMTGTGSMINRLSQQSSFVTQPSIPEEKANSAAATEKIEYLRSMESTRQRMDASIAELGFPSLQSLLNYQSGGAIMQSGRGISTSTSNFYSKGLEEERSSIDDKKSSRCEVEGMDEHNEPLYSGATSTKMANVDQPPREFNSFTGTIPLTMPEDKNWLIPLHCFLRESCVHIFCASVEEASTPRVGKGKPIVAGQVGICCPYCRTDDPRGQIKGSAYFPASIFNIYNSVMNLIGRHIHCCHAFPENLRKQYDGMKSDKGRSGSSKQYWIDSAKRLGLVDTEDGIRFALPSDSSKSAIAQDNASLGKSIKTFDLVLPEDKCDATDFAYYSMKQMRPCSFNVSDQIGKRQGREVGFPGLACRYCVDRCGSGRFFPLSLKTFSDSSKTLNVIYNHIVKCSRCPEEVKSALTTLKEQHSEQRLKIKFGSLKMFFVRVWNRLHQRD